MNNPVIEVVNLTKKFGSITALKTISLSVREGEIFGLIGPDGAGKTTLIRLMTTVMTPNAGKVNVLGYGSIKDPMPIKDNIGYMSQNFGLYQDLTVFENLKFYADIYNVSKRNWDLNINELLKFSGLTPFVKRKAGQLSGGMKQKLALACSLIHTPKVLFLDEPTNGVDPVSRREFWKILYKLVKDGLTVVISTSYLDEAERCDRIALMHKGEIIAYGSPKDIKRLMTEKIVKIQCREPKRTSDILKSNIKDLNITVFGDSVHIAVGNSEKIFKVAVKKLKSKGIEVLDIRTIQPELEDVLLFLTGNESE